MKTLKIITTGGTIDKLYFDDLSDYQIGKPIIGELLNTYHVGFDFEVVPLMKKDSIYINDEDREFYQERVERLDRWSKRARIVLPLIQKVMGG